MRRGLPQGSALFLETRYVTVFTKDQRTNYWPLVGGMRNQVDHAVISTA